MINALNYLLSAFVLTLNILLTLFLPIIVICLLLNVIADEQNKRLYQIAGWPGLMMTAWIGTPVHELSHAFAVLITGQKLVEVKLFAPDSRTGALGYVVHRCKNDNLFHAIIGNTIVPIAPFFGGAAVIYLISILLLPDFSLYGADVPRVHYLTTKTMFEWKNYLLFSQSIKEFYQYLLTVLANPALWSDWKFYVGVFLLFGIASHLSPSYSDFQNMWQPLGALILVMTLLNVFILPLVRNYMDGIRAFADRVLLIMPILLLALLVSIVGLIVIYGLFIIIMPFRRS
ncbi:hypothetical protein JW960_10575 [candidate division KSB1 bacterium]|nr:hypothetical protein [candidate division KSB1 bacterium]